MRGCRHCCERRLSIDLEGTSPRSSEQRNQLQYADPQCTALSAKTLRMNCCTPENSCSSEQFKPDDHSELVPLLPIPNRTVKRLSADDSAGSRVKVGHRQATLYPPTSFKPLQCRGFSFCAGRGSIQGEAPSASA